MYPVWHYATFRVASKFVMFLSEEQVGYLVTEFMPRIKGESISAMIDVVCHGLSILGSAQKHKISHQSLSKNLTRLKELQSKITNAGDFFPTTYLLEANAHALLMAEISFSDAKRLLVELCEKFGGNVESGYLGQGVKLYLDNTVTCIFLNPDESYEREWSYDQNDEL